MKNPGIFATSCAAINCDIHKQKHASNFFVFPYNESRCKLWVIKCRRLDLFSIPTKILSKYYSLCEKHFEEDCFVENKLVPNAVPTLFDFPLIRFNIPPLLNKPIDSPNEVADGDLIPGIKFKSINRGVQLPDNKIFLCGGPLLSPGCLAFCTQTNLMLHSSNVVDPKEKDILSSKYAVIIVGMVELSNSGYGEVKSLELFNVHTPYATDHWLKAPSVSYHLSNKVIPLDNCEIIKFLPNQKLPKTMTLNNLLVQHESHIDMEKCHLNANSYHFFTQSKSQKKSTAEHKYLAIAPLPPPLPSLTQEMVVNHDTENLLNEKKTPSILRKRKQKKESLVYESRPKQLANLLPKTMNLKTIALPPFMSVTGKECNVNFDQTCIPLEDVRILPPIQILQPGQITPLSTLNNSKESEILMASSNTGLVPVILSSNQITPPTTLNNSTESQNLITSSDTFQIAPPTALSNSKEPQITSPNAGSLPVITNVFSLESKLQKALEGRGVQVIAKPKNKDENTNKGENKSAELSDNQKSSNPEKEHLADESNERFQTKSTTSNKKKDRKKIVARGNNCAIIPPGLYSCSAGGKLTPLKVNNNKQLLKQVSHSVINPNDTSSASDKNAFETSSSQPMVPEICLDFIKTLNPEGKYILKLVNHSAGMTNMNSAERNEIDDLSGTPVDSNKLSTSSQDKGEEQPNHSASLVETTQVRPVEEKENSCIVSSSVSPVDEDDVTDIESHSMTDPNEGAYFEENANNDQIEQEIVIIDSNINEQEKGSGKTDDVVTNKDGVTEHMTDDHKGEQDEAQKGLECDNPLQVPNDTNCRMVTIPSSNSSNENNDSCSKQQASISNKALGGLLYEVNQMPITDQLKNKLKLVLKKREISKPVVASRKFVKIPVSQSETEVTQQMISNFLSELVKMDKITPTASKTINGPEKSIICAQDDASANAKKACSGCQDEASKDISKETLPENIPPSEPENESTVAKNVSVPNELKSYVFSNQALPSNIRNVIQNIFSSSKTVMVFKENTDKTKPCDDITYRESTNGKDYSSFDTEVPNEVVVGPNRSVKLSNVPLDSKDLPDKVKVMMEFYKDKVKKIILMKDCKKKCKRVDNINSNVLDPGIIEDNSQHDSVICDDDLEPSVVDGTDKVVYSNKTSSFPNSFSENSITNINARDKSENHVAKPIDTLEKVIDNTIVKSDKLMLIKHSKTISDSTSSADKESTDKSKTLSQQDESAFVLDHYYGTFEDHSYSAPAKNSDRALDRPDEIPGGVNQQTCDKTTSTSSLSIGVVRTASSANMPNHIKDLISSVTPKPNKVVVVKGNSLIPEVTDENGVISLAEPQIKEILDKINSVIDVTKDDCMNANANNSSVKPDKAHSTTVYDSSILFPLKKKLKEHVDIPRANPASIIRVTGENISTIPHSDKKLAEYVLGLKNEKCKLKREIYRLKKKVSKIQGDPPKFDKLMSRLADYLGPEAYSIVSTTAMLNKKNVGVGGARYTDELKRIAATIVLTGGWRPYRYLARIFSLPCKQSVVQFMNNSMAKITADSTAESINEPESNINNTAPLNESFNEENNDEDIIDESAIQENNNIEPINELIIPENNNEEEVPGNSKARKKRKVVGKLSDFYMTLLRNKIRSEEKKKLAEAKKLVENNRNPENKNTETKNNTKKKRKNTDGSEIYQHPEGASAPHKRKSDKKIVKKKKRALPHGSNSPAFHFGGGSSRTTSHNDPLFYFSLNDIRRKGFLDPIEMMDMQEQTPSKQQQAYEDLVQEIIMEHESESSLSNSTVLEEVVIEDFANNDIDMSHAWLS